MGSHSFIMKKVAELSGEVLQPQLPIPFTAVKYSHHPRHSLKTMDYFRSCIKKKKIILFPVAYITDLLDPSEFCYSNWLS